MTERLVPAAKYLTYTEAIGLYNALVEIGVISLVKSCGPPSLPFGEGLYFQLLVKEAELSEAEPVLADFTEKQARIGIEAQTCPHCGSVHVWPTQDLAWWKKILYAGTTVYTCQDCHTTFFA